jgi:hypothetical protein
VFGGLALEVKWMRDTLFSRQLSEQTRDKTCARGSFTIPSWRYRNGLDQGKEAGGLLLVHEHP